MRTLTTTSRESVVLRRGRRGGSGEVEAARRSAWSRSSYDSVLASGRRCSLAYLERTFPWAQSVFDGLDLVICVADRCRHRDAEVGRLRVIDWAGARTR